VKEADQGIKLRTEKMAVETDESAWTSRTDICQFHRRPRRNDLSVLILNKRPFSKTMIQIIKMLEIQNFILLYLGLHKTRPIQTVLN